MDGNLYWYTVVCADGKPGSFIPPSLLTSGVSRISREGSAYEEYSDEADIVNYNTPFQLKNHLTTMRLTYDITGDAYSSVMVIAMKDPKTGKQSYLWSDYQEWRALRQWYETIERFSVYSKFNANQDGTTDLKGTNGRAVYIGAGLLEQIAPSNRETYTKLSSDVMEDFLFNLSYQECCRVMNYNGYDVTMIYFDPHEQEIGSILKECERKGSCGVFPDFYSC